MKHILLIAVTATALASPPALGQEISAENVTVVKSKVGPTALFTGGALPLKLIDTDEIGMLIGHGFDPITGRILPMQCVSPLGPQSVLQGTKPFKRREQVTDQKSYASSSGSSFGISAVIKAVSIGVGTSHASGKALNSVDSYGRLFNRIATKGSEYQLVQWAPSTAGAPSPVSLLKTDPASFMAQCGTYFVRGVYSGQQLDTLTRFVVHQNSNQSADATSVSIGVAQIFGASASFANAAAQANQHSNAFIENNGKGDLGVAILAASAPSSRPTTPPASENGTQAPPAPSPAPTPPSTGGTSASAGAGAEIPTDTSGIKVMLDYYENGFARAIAALTPDQVEKSAQPLYIVIDHYQGNMLPLAGRIPIWADDIYDAIDSKIDIYNALIMVIADLETALASGPSPRLGVFFEDPTAPDPDDPQKTARPTAPKRLQAAKDVLKSFQGAVKRCQKLITDGVEKPGQKTAAQICQDDLDANLKDDQVTALALTRKFPPPSGS